MPRTTFIPWAVRTPGGGGPGAFTLIEVMVSCAVLAILVALLSSTFSNFAGLTSSSGRRIETGNQIRTVFDRMAFDLSSSVRDGGIEIQFAKNAQVNGGAATVNDAIGLLTDARSTTAGSRLARVGYEVADDQNPAVQSPLMSLFRCVEPFLWTDNSAETGLSANAERQPLGRGVFRMELSFLKTDGSLVAAPPAADEIAAVVCSTAWLDAATYAQLPDGTMQTLAAALPDAVDGALPLSSWNADRFAFFPPAVARNVRFHQRQFYLK